MKMYLEISEMAKLLPKRPADCFIDFLSSNIDERTLKRTIAYWNRIATFTREDKHSLGGGHRERTTKKRKGKNEHPYNNAKKVVNLLYKVKTAKDFTCDMEGFKPSESQVKVLDTFKKNSREIQILNRSRSRGAGGVLVRDRKL